MKWFYNLKISTKLLSAFILVALIAGVVGYTGISQITKIAQADRALYEREAIPLAEITSVNDAFQRIRVDNRALIITQDSTAKQKLIDDIEKLDSKIEEKTTQFEKTLNTSEGRSEFEKLRATLNNLDIFMDTFIKLNLANKEAEAITFLQKEGPPIVDGVDKSLSKLIDMKMLQAQETADRNTASAAAATRIMIILISIAVILAVALGFFIARTISKPVQTLAQAADKLAQGDLNVRLEATTQDEIGILSKSFGIMVDNLNEILGEINQASEQIAAGAGQVSDTSQSLSQASTEQASSTEEITATMTEISSQTKQNALNANQANELATSAKENAIKGNQEMQEMLKSMGEINDASANISKIIKVIDEIAFQTNILALNAAVEAARAGQHGKGFAVVAEEVRNLAARSANAAKETTVMIEGSISKVELGTKIANETAGALNKIVEGVSTVADLVGDIAVASNEQATAIAQVNQGIAGISEVTQMNTATAQQSAAASEELASQAELLRDRVNRFKLAQGGSALTHIQGINPDIIRAIEDMMDKAKPARTGGLENSRPNKPVSLSKVKISLDDGDFGKY